jgi:hypothetical protein
MGFFDWVSYLQEKILIFFGITEEEEDIDVLLSQFLIKYEVPEVEKIIR